MNKEMSDFALDYIANQFLSMSSQKGPWWKLDEATKDLFRNDARNAVHEWAAENNYHATPDGNVIGIHAMRHDVLYHIGSMRVEDRGSRGESLEGHMLSVSTCPQAWSEIARLGGGPLHRLSKPGGALFLDVAAASQDPAIRGVIVRWALDRGLVEPKMLWKAWSWNEDAEEWNYSLHPSKAKAGEEINEEDRESNGPDGKGCVRRVNVLVGTAELADRVNIGNLSCTDAFEFAAAIWVEDTQPQIDGLWWEERYAPDLLSAPRGGILPGRIIEFVVEEISWADAPDNEDAEQGYRITVPFANNGTMQHPLLKQASRVQAQSNDM